LKSGRVRGERGEGDGKNREGFLGNHAGKRGKKKSKERLQKQKVFTGVTEELPNRRGTVKDKLIG